MTLEELTTAVALRIKDPAYQLMAQTDYQEHVLAGILEYSRHRPYHRKGSLALVSEVADYTAPTDFIKVLKVEWGNKTANDAPWENRAVTGVPSVLLVDGQLHLDPIPTAGMIAAWGSVFNYLYQAQHVVDANTSTIPAQDDILVRLAALRSACLEIAAASDQSEAFVRRYYTLAKRYGERFKELIGAVRPLILRG